MLLNLVIGLLALAFPFLIQILTDDVRKIAITRLTPRFAAIRRRTLTVFNSLNRLHLLQLKQKIIVMP